MTNAPAHAATIDDIDDALAKLALLMRAQGEHGLVYLPIFERLERERETMASLDDRLDRALARAGVRSRPLRSPPPPTANPRYSRISAA